MPNLKYGVYWHANYSGLQGCFELDKNPHLGGCYRDLKSRNAGYLVAADDAPVPHLNPKKDDDSKSRNGPNPKMEAKSSGQRRSQNGSNMVKVAGRLKSQNGDCECMSAMSKGPQIWDTPHQGSRCKKPQI